MSNRHLMIDIETLSTNNDAAIIAIGVAVFNRIEIVDSHLWLIDPIWAIGHRDQRTFDEFWNDREKVSDEVQARMFSGYLKPWEAVDQYRQFMEMYNLQGVWANPPQFDIVIMRSLFDALELPCPIHWRDERDCRTLFRMARSLGVDLQSAYEGREAHDAQHDAIAQARAIQIIWDRLYQPGQDVEWVERPEDP